MFDFDDRDIESWEGVIGPQSDAVTWFYRLEVQDDVVQLSGPSDGLDREVDREEFEAQVATGEWIRATNDWVNTVFSRIK